jgi:glycosyltransferase involved in cell wall biosynthesis
VVFVTIADLPEGGGNTTRLKNLASAVAESGHSVLLLNEHGLGVAPQEMLKPAGQFGAVEYRYILNSVERGFGFRSLGTKLRAVFRLAREIRTLDRRNKIDVLWFNNLSFYDIYPLSVLASRLGIKTVQSYEDERLEVLTPQVSLSRKIFSWNSRLADRYCPRMADAVIVISEYLRQKYMQRTDDPGKVHVIPTIVKCEDWNVGPEPVSDTPTLFYSGCFGDQDEIENLLAALALLRDRGQGFRAVFFGASREPGRVAKIQAEVESLRLTDRVEMRGFVPLEQVRKEMANATVLLNIRRDGVWSRSGLSTKLSEYLAAGRTVICTDLGDAARYVRHGESALLVPPTTTAEEIVITICQALDSKSLRQKIGRGAREVAKLYFDMPVVAKSINAILQSVVRS